MGRLLTLKKRIGASGTLKTIATNSYNEIGQVTTKNIGGIEDQSLDYNIRGWLRGVNRSNLEAGIMASKFAYELAYDNVTGKLNADYGTAQYNGNISGMMWRSFGDHENRKYNFTYDTVYQPPIIRTLFQR